MNADSRPVAYFARGIDGFYLLGDHRRGVALVRADTPEAAWAEQFLPADQLLRYRPGHVSDPIYPTTEEIICKGDLGEALAARGISDLLLSSAISPAIQQWSVDHCIRLWAADYEHQIRLENKLWFDRFLKRHDFPHPPGFVATIGQPVRPPKGWPDDRPIVVQRAESLGGEGTYFLASTGALQVWAVAQGLPIGERCLVRQWIDGEAFGITLLIAPGVISLSAVRQQCYYPSRGATKTFAGIQWLPSESLSPAILRRIEEILLSIGRQLYRMQFFGLANCDFLVNAENRPLVIECNPRMSAATPQLFMHRSLGGDVSMGKAFLDGLAVSRVYRKRPQEFGIPNTSFEGATLDIVPPTGNRAGATVARDFPSGTYRLPSDRIEYLRTDVRCSPLTSGRAVIRPDEFCLFSFGARGQPIASDTTLATIFANFRLYDATGELTTAGRRLANFFQYT